MVGLYAVNTFDKQPFISIMDDSARPPLSKDESQENTVFFENDSVELSEEAEEIKKLERRDQEVRQHEQAHKAVGGSYAGSIVYEYTTGPDGKRYASGGHVNFYVSKEPSAEATIRKAETIYRAALAPADPSGSDMRLAQEAMKLKQEAQSQQRDEKQSAIETDLKNTRDTTASPVETSVLNIQA